MKDDVGLESLHHLEHAVALLAVGEHGLDPGEVPVSGHLTIDLEQVVLGVVEQHEQLRAHAGDLAHELGADRAAGAGDQHALVGEIGADAIEGHDDGIATEHVLDADLAQLTRELDAAAQELEHGRQGPHLDVTVAALGDDLAPQHAGRRGNRDHHLVGRAAVEHLSDLIGGPEHLQALGLHAALSRVVVDEADRPGAEVRD